MPARTTMTPLRTIFTGALLVLIGASTLLAWAVIREARVVGPERTIERSAEVAPAPVPPRVRPPERADFLPG